MIEMEFWKPVRGYEGWYSVSSFGRVRRDAGGQGAQAGAILSPWLNKNGKYWRPVVDLNRGGESRRVYVHRLVREAFAGPIPEGQDVDHIDRDSTNNSAWNLRLATRSQNMANGGPRAHGKSKFRGVYWFQPTGRGTGRWRAQITVNYDQRLVGSFGTEEEAARAYDAAAREAFGEFARLNFP